MSDQSCERVFGFFPSFSFVVGTVVGTGIYLKPALVVNLLGSPNRSLLLWFLVGLFTLAGGVVYARLAEEWPETGGAYLYLRQVYGRWAASLLLAADIFVGRPAAVGALATGIGLVWGLGSGEGLALGVLFILVFTVVQLSGARSQGNSQVALTALQLIPLGAVLLCWLWSGGQAEPATSGSADTPRWGAAFLAILWAYDGWYNITILTGEVKVPGKIVRRALVGGMAGVIGLYLSLQLVLFHQLSLDLIRSSQVPFLLLFQQWGLPAVGLFLKISLTVALLATLNGTVACGSRMMVAAARDRLVPARLDCAPTSVGPTICFSLLCLGLLLLFGGLPLSLNLFDSLSELTAVVVALLSALTVSCLFHRDRFRGSIHSLEYLCAAFYLLVSSALVYLLVQESHWLSLWGAGLVGTLGTLTWWKGRVAELS